MSKFGGSVDNYMTLVTYTGCGLEHKLVISSAASKLFKYKFHNI